MYSPKTSTHHHHLHMQQLHVVAAENDSSLLCQDKQPFFLRLLQRDNSLRGSSTRYIAASLVPFMWEDSAGSPKPDLLSNPNDDHNHFLIRPLTPPPRLQSPSHDSFNQSRNNINPDNDSQPRRSLTSTLKTVLSGRRTGSLSASNSLISASLSPRSSLDENCLSSASLKSSNPSFSASNHGVLSLPEDDMDALKEGFAELRMQCTQPQNTTLMIRSKYKKRASPMTKGCFCFLPTGKA